LRPSAACCRTLESAALVAQAIAGAVVLAWLLLCCCSICCCCSSVGSVVVLLVVSIDCVAEQRFSKFDKQQLSSARFVECLSLLLSAIEQIEAAAALAGAMALLLSACSWRCSASLVGAGVGVGVFDSSVSAWTPSLAVQTTATCKLLGENDCMCY
jgi:hypothetical protein